MKISHYIKPKSYGNLTINILNQDKIPVYSKIQKIDSFLKHYWMMIYNRMLTSYYYNGSINEFIVMGGNADRPTSLSNFGFKANSGQYSGIVIGSSNLSISFVDHQLNSLIEHGIGNGQMFYRDQELNSDRINGIYTISRVFQNNTDQNITVGECGLATRSISSSNPTTPALAILCVKDLFEQTVVVPSGYAIEIVYKFQLSEGTLNAYTHFFESFFGNAHSNIFFRYTDQLGVSRTANGYANSMIGNAGDINRGILVGTSNQPISFNDYDLVNLIASGTGNGELTHGAPFLGIPVFDDENGVFYVDMWRQFTNNTANPITIREIGYKGVNTYNSSNANGWIMDRKILPTPVTLNAGQSRLFSYRTIYQF